MRDVRGVRPIKVANRRNNIDWCAHSRFTTAFYFYPFQPRIQIVSARDLLVHVQIPSLTAKSFATNNQLFLFAQPIIQYSASRSLETNNQFRQSALALFSFKIFTFVLLEQLITLGK
jgi:hypothetical protein